MQCYWKKWKKFQNGIIEVVVGENWEKNKHLLLASNEQFDTVAQASKNFPAHQTNLNFAEKTKKSFAISQKSTLIQQF